MIHRIRDSQTANLTCPTDVFELTTARRTLTVGDPTKSTGPKAAICFVCECGVTRETHWCDPCDHGQNRTVKIAGGGDGDGGISSPRAHRVQLVGASILPHSLLAHSIFLGLAASRNQHRWRGVPGASVHVRGQGGAEDRCWQWRWRLLPHGSIPREETDRTLGWTYGTVNAEEKAAGVDDDAVAPRLAQHCRGVCEVQLAVLQHRAFPPRDRGRDSFTLCGERRRDWRLGGTFPGYCWAEQRALLQGQVLLHGQVLVSDPGTWRQGDGSNNLGQAH
jgi:hypothetical protein